MKYNESGMALVSVVLILAVLLTMAHILFEKIWQSTRHEAAVANREQLFWSAQAGIEVARQRLAENYSTSGGWHSFLAAGTPGAYPSAPAWVIDSTDLSVEIYLRDNPDGDRDVRNDNDLKLFVLTRARGRRGAEVMVESLCGLDLPAGGRYASQAEQLNSRLGTGLAELPVTSHGITD